MKKTKVNEKTSHIHGLEDNIANNDIQLKKIYRFNVISMKI